MHRFASPASWVDVAAPNYDAPEPPGAAGDGASFLLLDRQLTVVDGGDDYYQHFAVKVLTAAGVEDHSQINLTLDPAYQALDIHWLRLVRNGEVLDQRPIARITTLPQETELRYRVYNGRYNVNVLMSDVRVGDVVDVAFTLRSQEKIFPGHFATRLDTAWSSLVHRQRIRVHAPPGRPLRHRYYAGSGASAQPPQIREAEGELTLEWSDLAALAVDRDIPIWHYPWPFIEISDLDTWEEAARLVHPLYTDRLRTSPGVRAIADQIRAAGGSVREHALRALQYVQEEIRYTSISIGRGSHEPSELETILERRFGDCKDKSLLLVAILGELGIEARPALVHTERRHALADALPTPYAFNHVIVRARIDADVYWLDATGPTRYSPLSVHDPVDYALALPLDGTSGLEQIPQPASDMRRRDVYMVFDLRKGLEAPGTLEMMTEYRDALADAMRPFLARVSSEQRQADYASYIARYYPQARAAGAVTVHDDKASNVIRVSERYLLERAFQRDENNRLNLYLHADELYIYAEPLATGLRRAPLAIEYPVRVRQHIVAHLPEPWTVRPKSVNVHNPAFRYRSEVSYAGRTLEVHYDYEALADHVPAATVAAYLIDRGRVYEDLGYVLTYNDGLLSGDVAVAPLPLVTTLLALGIGLWVAVRWGYRYDPEPKHTREGAPSGIRGWLLLPAIGTLLGPVVWLVVMAAWAPLLDAEAWYAVPAVVADTYASTADVVVLVIMAGSAVLVVMSVLAVVLFFTKRTSAPALFIALSWAGLAFAAAVAAWSMASGFDTETSNAKLLGETIRDILVATIWTAYMLSSGRVRATFVRRRASPGAQPASITDLTAEAPELLSR